MTKSSTLIAILCPNTSSKKLLVSKLAKALSGDLKILNSDLCEIDDSTFKIGLLTKNTWIEDLFANRPSVQLPTHIFYIKPSNSKQATSNNANLFDSSKKDILERDPKKLSKFFKFISSELKYRAILRKFTLSDESIDHTVSQMVELINKDVELLSPKKITLSSTMAKGDLFLLSKDNFSGQSLITSDHYILKPDTSKAPIFSASEIEKYACHFKNIGKTFSLDQFNEPRHPPVPLGQLNNHSDLDQPFDTDIVQIQNMPIAFPSTKTEYCYRVPTSCKKLNEFIQKVINFWHTVEPNAHEYYAYLSVSQGPVPPWKSQRIPGIHCEGFQQFRPYKTCEYTFTCVNSLPTVYYIQSFDPSKIDPKQSFFKQFVMQTQPEPVECQAPYEISMMDPYCFHSAVINTSDITTYRTFARIIYSTSQYDRSYNTHNPAFEYNWNRQPVQDPY